MGEGESRNGGEVMQPIPLSKPMTPELARAIYAVLVAGLDVPKNECDAFVDWFSTAAFSERDTWTIHCRNIVIVNRGAIEVSTFMSDTDSFNMVDRTMRALAVLMEKE